MKTVIELLEKKGYKTVSSDFYAHIEDWKNWYSCTVDDFHKTQFNNGLSIVTKQMKMLGMAKTVCEIWANLEMNERVKVSVGDETNDEKLLNVLNENKFWKNANQLCELCDALGTGAFVEYLSNGEIRIDYLQADMIYPLSWDSRGITECAFSSLVHVSNRDCVYLQIHRLDGGKYVIENHLYEYENSEIGEEVDLPEGLEEEYITGSEVPLFQIIKPNIVNNLDTSNPMGISVFANAIDVLKGIDLTYDAMDVEIDTGRRMVMLSADKFIPTATGFKDIISNKEKIIRYIDGMDEELIKDYSPEFRSSALKEMLELQLSLLGEKCGMGTNMFEFTPKGVKTATEVISEDSDLYQNLKKHEIILEEAIGGMIKAIEVLSGSTGEKVTVKDIQITFDDSIIQDKEAERQQYKEEVAMNIMSPVEYRMRVYNEDEETAKKMIPDIPEPEVKE